MLEEPPWQVAAALAAKVAAPAGGDITGLAALPCRIAALPPTALVLCTGACAPMGGACQPGPLHVYYDGCRVRGNRCADHGKGSRVRYCNTNLLRRTAACRTEQEPLHLRCCHAHIVRCTCSRVQTRRHAHQARR